MMMIDDDEGRFHKAVVCGSNMASRSSVHTKVNKFSVISAETMAVIIRFNVL